MISGILRNRKEDMMILQKELQYQTAYRTNEKLAVTLLLTEKDLEDFLEKRDLADIICVDVSVFSGIADAKRLRIFYPKAAIVVIAEVSMSPITYMQPSILAAALLLRPLAESMVREVLGAVFEQYIETKEEEDVFVIETREDKERIPVQSILYFEAREKKVYACTKNRAFGFYDTIDALEKKMEGKFVRCHRSYLVNASHIKKVMLSKNCINLEYDIEIPLSRSYKSEIKQVEINGNQ